MCAGTARKRTEMQYTHKQHRHGNSCTTSAHFPLRFPPVLKGVTSVKVNGKQWTPDEKKKV